VPRPGRSAVPFAVLASAIASRRLNVEVAHNEPTYTDGQTIFVDAAMDAADVRDAVAVQAALLAGDALSSSSEESLTRALSREPIPSPPEWAGALKPARLWRVSESDLRASPTDEDLMRLNQLEERPPQPEDESPDDSDESKIVNLLSVPMQNPLGDAIQKLLGMGRSAPDKNQGGGEIPVAKQRFGPVGRNARRGRLSQMLSAVLAPAPVVGIRYPEWDCNKGHYRPDWCTVGEYDPAETDAASDKMMGGPSLHRALARVGIELEHHRRQFEGDIS
jgi:nitric oxide reductase NorD protein